MSFVTSTRDAQMSQARVVCLGGSLSDAFGFFPYGLLLGYRSVEFGLEGLGSRPNLISQWSSVDGGSSTPEFANHLSESARSLPWPD